MRSRLLAFATMLLAMAIVAGLNAPTIFDRVEHDGSMGEPGPYPSDWFGLQRAYPYAAIPQHKVQEALARARADRTAAAREASAYAAGGRSADARFGAAGLASLTWTEAGPFNIGGRVTALAAKPGGVTVFLASANGGVFKSTNSGVNWRPVSDDLGFFSVGALALDPTNNDILYVGTGEANSSVDSYDGNGLWRMKTGDSSWVHLGLTETARIGRVVVDPSNPQRLYVAAMGKQFSTDSNRGLYRSEDGGATWTQALFVNDSTGCADVVLNPAHPETVYAAMWERIRRPTYRRAYGPGCRIWRSIDSGQTWSVLANGLPAPSDSVGRIGLAISAAQPSRVYAQIITGANGGYTGLGLYRSDDGGDTWLRRDASGFTGIFGGFGWYFGDVVAHPLISDQVWSLGVQLVRSTNGGVNFTTMTGGAHVDQHAMWIDPTNPSRIYLGNDGGFYWSLSGGTSWNKSLDLPITQFYAGTIDPSNPARLLGGTQDNNTLITSGSPSGWSAILGGDGFYCQVHPTNPSIILAEYQFCCSNTGPRRSTTGGGSWSTPSGIVGSDRFNWNTPFLMSPHDPNIVLLGSQRVYKSTNNGASYAIVSGDLTTNPAAALTFGTITTLDVSPVSALVYYAGTDDGKVWRSEDAGSTWEDISAGLPSRYVTRVTADPANSNVVYVTHSGFGIDEPLPHVHRSTNRGDTWNDISSNLPDAPANDILVDPSDPQTLFLGTDVGVYASRNLGGSWFPLGMGMPIQTIFDLTLHQPSRTLVAATHGRSQWKLDLNELPVAVGPAPSPSRLALSTPRPNPSAGVMQLSLELDRATTLQVDVYDALGRRVRSLASGAFAAGSHTIAWDGRDARGRSAEPGMFFVRAEGGAAVVTRSIVRVR